MDQEIDSYLIDIYSDAPGLTLSETITSYYDPEEKKVLQTYPTRKSPAHLTRDDLRARIIKARGSLCRSSINPAYLHHAIEKANMLLVMYQLYPVFGAKGAVKTKEEVKGFIVGSVREDNSMYLDVLCAQNGRVILTALVELCKIKKIDFIILNSLVPVLGYYPQFGFSHRKDCDASKPAAIDLPEKVSRRLRRIDATADIYSDAIISDFMLELHRLGFTAPESVKCRGPLTRDEFAERGCAGNGFEMRLCLKDIPVIPNIEDENVVAAAPPPARSSIRLLRPSNLVSQTRRNPTLLRPSNLMSGRKPTLLRPSNLVSQTRRNPTLLRPSNLALQQSFMNYKRTRKLTAQQRNAFKTAFASLGIPLR